MLPNNYKWRMKPIETHGNIVEKVLYGRGICEEAERQVFLKPSKAHMHSPYLMNDMDLAVKRIQEAKVNNEHIVIYGDYDVDGVTSTSILYMFLKEQGYEVSYYIPNRTEEGYGLNNGALLKIRQYGQLLITVDTGIAAIGEVAYGKSIGLDIIVTDHHECQETLPDAYCILNPKRPDTTYPFDALAGVGVTFKLIHGLALAEDAEDKIWKYIDIVALGTVADVVPLEKENRVITYLGFKQMQESIHLGIKALLNLLQSDTTKITSNIIGYQLGPRINAAGRISDAKIGVELLTTTDQGEATRIAQLLDEENKKRQDMEQAILLEAEKYIEEHIDIEKEKMIIVAGENWHHGVIGIVASRILGKYYKPTIVLTKEDGIYSGSARSVEGFNIFEAISSVKDRLLRFGGHEMAAGLSLNEGELDAFRRELNAYGEDLLTEDILTPGLEVDLEVDAKDLSLGLCEQLEGLEPFGVSNPTPIFAVKGLVQYAQKIGQDKHLKISIQKGHQVLHGVGFDKGYLADCLTEGEEVVMACELTKNTWNGKTSLQLRIKDIMSPNEKILRSKYYMGLYRYLTVPEPIALEKLKLVSLDIPKEQPMDAYTEKGFEKLIKSQGNQEKNITKLVDLWYNGCRVFNQDGHYEWDFKSEGTYPCLNRSLTNHIEQLPMMIPSYVDCKDVYKYFRIGDGRLYMHKVVEHFVSRHMTEYKVLQILDIFSELELISYTLTEGEIHYTLGKTSKTQLEKSPRYMTLQKYEQSISN
ncbi:MAG: single-stranded-DNA-specific exonuclease RecJ [Cellulosilyticaceae bacterium]